MQYKCGNPPQADQTAAPEKYPQGYFKPKSCRVCGTTFTPAAPSHLLCSQTCVDTAYTNRYLQRVYGISKQDYDVMYQHQGGICAICGGEGFLMDDARHKVKLVVDHDHVTGKVRGLLCHNCNRALGLLHDNTKHLEAAIHYLKAQRLS